MKALPQHKEDYKEYNLEPIEGETTGEFLIRMNTIYMIMWHRLEEALKKARNEESIL